LFGQFYDSSHVVLRSGFDAVFKAASLALIIDYLLSPFDFHTHGLHRATALCRAVTRINIHVPRPQTFGAVIGVARALNSLPAMAADKILYFALKFFA